MDPLRAGHSSGTLNECQLHLLQDVPQTLSLGNSFSLVDDEPIYGAIREGHTLHHLLRLNAPHHPHRSVVLHEEVHAVQVV